MGMSAESIVRRGNHFIHLDGCGWVLIDGPWYKQLEGYIDRPYMIMHSLKPVSIAMIDPSEPYPDTIETKEVTWERVKWHSGFGLHFYCTYNSIVVEYKGHLIGFKGVRIEERWQKCLSHRLRLGWRMLPDGKLPAYLCQMELEEDMMHSNYLMERGY